MKVSSQSYALACPLVDNGARSHCANKGVPVQLCDGLDTLQRDNKLFSIDQLHHALDLLSSQCLQLTLLPKHKLIHHDLAPRRHSDLEAVATLLDLGDALQVLPLLDQLIRQT